MAEESKNSKPEVSKKSPEKSNKPAKEKVKFSVKFKKFIRDYKSEIKKIVWPTKQQVIKNTSVVLFVIIIIATFVGVLDLLFGFGINAIARL